MKFQIDFNIIAEPLDKKERDNLRQELEFNIREVLNNTEHVQTISPINIRWLMERRVS